MALIYDVGMHYCEDTSYYLWQGHTVVAIEANPHCIHYARKTLSRCIETGTLILVHAAIGEQNGFAEFWIPSRYSQWASLDKGIAERQSGSPIAITVPTTTLEAVISQHSVPDYLKIDIEGADELCLSTLANGNLPPYVSIESECLAEDEECSNDAALSTLNSLYLKGYRAFQLIDQYTLTVITERDLCPMRRLGTMGVASRRMLHEKIGWKFPHGASGPWGTDLPGDWISYEDARCLYLEARHCYFAGSHTQNYGLWCDWHAKVIP